MPKSRPKLFASLMLVITFGLLASPFGDAIAQTPEASPVASPEAVTPTFEEDACMYDLPTGVTEGEDVFCGWVTAPMYPNGSGEGTVQLPIMRFASTSDSPAEDPLLILLGGPGQDMSAVLPLFGDEYPLWRYMLERQDVILFDQRGMGQSTPTLACPFEREGSETADAAVGLQLLQCGATLKGEGIDPLAFNTKNNAADIEAIRVAMGYDQVNLYGISYGSKLALSAIRDYPDSIRSTVIASPLPLEIDPFAGQTIGFAESLDTLWADCAADDVCSKANPDPEAAFLASIERLKSEPMTISLTDPTTGDTMELPIDDIQFMQVLYLGVFVGEFTPLVPYLVTSVAEGDDSILQLFAPALLSGGGLSLGATFGYFCTDEVPFSPQAGSAQAIADANLPAPFTDGSWIGLGDQAYQICQLWDFPTADPVEAEAVESDDPMLIFTGKYDPITPPSFGDLVHENFPNSQLVQIESQGHDPASLVNDCSGPMIMAFLDDPTAEVDASCAATPIDFSLPDMEATPVASPAVKPIG